jgi:hypothetical protein
MVYYINSTLKAVSNPDSKYFSDDRDLWVKFCKQYGLSELEAVCTIIYTPFKTQQVFNDSFPYDMSYQDFLSNARAGFEKLKQCNESLIQL